MAASLPQTLSFSYSAVPVQLNHNIPVHDKSRRRFVNRPSTCLAMTWNTIHSDADVPPPSEWTLRQYEDALGLYNTLHACQDRYLKHELHRALKCLLEAYRLYGPENVIGSYNGGKDAVAILHLMRAAKAQYYYMRQQSGEDDRSSDVKLAPRVLYFENKGEFPQVVDLLHETVKEYDLDMIAFSQDAYSFATGLKLLVDGSEENEKKTKPPSQLAFVLGTRSSDPNAKGQGQFSPSSDWMPPFMRVNPILDWTFGHVWHFLRKFNLPYCSLYDEGYTSLGSVHDTRPCPSLAKPGGGGYWPAYMLSDWGQERAGRQNSNQKASKKEIKASCTNVEIDDIDDESSYSSMSTASNGSIGVQRTVGLLIIGDEILKGQTNDTNTNAAASALRANGVPLSRVVVVPDDLDEIVSELRSMRRAVDVVVTSGGVGPTHDDITMLGVSTALNSPLVLHQEMSDFLREKSDSNDGKLTDAQLKMATLPDCGKLCYLAGKEDWPTLKCDNIFVLPGVPQFFEKKIKNLATYLAGDQPYKACSCKIVLSIEEISVAPILNKLVENHPYVSFGSYPFVGHPEINTVVTIEAHECEGPTRSSRRRSSTFSGPIITEDSLEPSALVATASIARASSNTARYELRTFTQKEMDFNLKSALNSLIDELPESSVLRVDNEDFRLE